MMTPNPVMLKVSIVSRYGVDVIRPECELSKGFVKLLRQKTFTSEDVRLIKDLGYVFEVVVKEEPRRVL